MYTYVLSSKDFTRIATNNQISIDYMECCDENTAERWQRNFRNIAEDLCSAQQSLIMYAKAAEGIYGHERFYLTADGANLRMDSELSELFLEIREQVSDFHFDPAGVAEYAAEIDKNGNSLVQKPLTDIVDAAKTAEEWKNASLLAATLWSRASQTAIALRELCYEGLKDNPCFRDAAFLSQDRSAE